jgi:anti-anti-sigma factor
MDQSTAEIVVEPDGDHVVVAPFGDLDARSADAVERKIAGLVARGFTDVVLDLSGLSFVDSSGAELLERLEADAYARGHTFNVRASAGTGASRRRPRRRFERAPLSRSL